MPTWGIATAAIASAHGGTVRDDQAHGGERGPAGYDRSMAEETFERDVVHESALQLWAAAQTDFDPFQVPPAEWRDAVPVRDVDIAVDCRLELEVVRERLRDLDGERLVIGHDAGNLSVVAPIPEA